MLTYELGGMRGIDGSVLRNEVEAKATEQTIAISNIVERMGLFNELANMTPSPRLLLYFQFNIRRQIYPFVRQACVIQWYMRNNKELAPDNRKVRMPRAGVFILLKRCWIFQNVPAVFEKPFNFYITHPACLRNSIKNYLKYGVEKMAMSIGNTRPTAYSSKISGNAGTVACHYAEGVEPLRRNDLGWFSESGINPERVLIYFDERHAVSAHSNIGTRIRKEIVKQIEKKGFRWVALKKNLIENQGQNYWRPRQPPKGLPIRGGAIKDDAERWAAGLADKLLRDVHYWRSFHNEFNVKIHYVTEESAEENIAQAIAFDIEKERCGLLVGKQRSEYIYPHIGYHPKHVFFPWNRRTPSHLSDLDKTKSFVISGYPYNNSEIDKNMDTLEFSKRLKSHGVRLIVALFDNMHGPDIHFSTSAMAEFYRAFLQWILDDSTFGLIIKSKKPYVIKNLPSIHPILRKALDTGRCLKIEDGKNRFASDAASGADLSVGCGISSAVVEIAIGGARGIHYDMTRSAGHEFYEWGYGRLIFDDLAKMIEALKKYREDPVHNSGIGDWSRWRNDLDPFCDGRGGERIGIYLHWLLDRFDAGDDAAMAMAYANKMYRQRWGGDKVID